MNKTSIIIVNYNCEDHILKCVNSINDYLVNDTYEIIIVDNKSSNESITFIEENLNSVRLVKLDKNYGFGKACNIGVSKSKYENILFLNPDVVLKSDILTQFNRDYSELNNVGVLGGVFYDLYGNRTHSYNRFPSLIGDVISILYNNERRSIKSKERLLSVDSITGACMFLSKENFLKVEGFDECFFMYFEETDLQLRFKKINLLSYIDLNIEMIHVGSVTLSNRKNKDCLFFKSKKYYYKKNLNFFTYLVSNLSISIISLLKIVIDLMFFDKKRFIAHFNVARSHFRIN